MISDVLCDAIEDIYRYLEKSDIYRNPLEFRDVLISMTAKMFNLGCIESMERAMKMAASVVDARLNEIILEKARQ